jgi:hypothetical protein
MRLVVLQSNYIPWKGYFDLLNLADLFVVYDSVQYTKNDWRNRNVLVGAQGPTWLTIPVETAGRAGQSINQAQVSNDRWARKHWMTVVQLLGKRPFFHLYSQEWEELYALAAQMESLHDINVLFLSGLAKQLNIDTLVRDDSEFDLPRGSPTERLVALCTAAGATSYVTGPAGLGYLELRCFDEAGIGLEVIDYSLYAPYPQGGKDFTHGVSVLDLLANVGPEAASHLGGVSQDVTSTQGAAGQDELPL